MRDAPYTDDFSGTTRFAVQRRIGAGGMGVVYRAYDRERNECVAVKTLRHLDARAIYRLKREFRALADLTHPNLVSLHELFSEGGQWFFTMEFVEGCNLLTYVRSGPSTKQVWIVAEEHPTDGATEAYVPEADPSTLESATASTSTGDVQLPSSDEGGADGREVVPPSLSHGQLVRLRSAFVQLAEAVSALHQAGTLHRDVKPSNVLVTRDDRVVLLDFGLATEYLRGERSLTTEEHFVGTVPYVSPEQAAGLQLSPASDWYSVGVMLYELMTGRRPFLGRSLQVLMDKQEFEPPPPRELVAELPEDLNALCVGLLRRNPDLRFSGREVLRRLGSAPSDAQVPPSTHSTETQVPFIGRERHLNALDDAFSTMKQGRTVVVYVHGRSGAGKTALVRRFLRGIRGDEQTVVLLGRCYERESVPYKALDSLVDALSHYLVRLPREKVESVMPRDVVAMARVFPVLRRVEAVAEARTRVADVPDRQELRERGFAALRELLARLGDRSPLVLFIDDLQWGDLDSVALLNDLLAPPDPPILLLIACYRSEDRAASPVLRGILETEAASSPLVDVRQMSVDPLSHEEARELAVSLLGGDDPAAQPVGDAIARESGGNPYFVDALVRHQQAGTAAAGDFAPTQAISLDEVLWARAERLPEIARRLLEVVAVAGHPLRQMDAFRATDLSSQGRDALGVLRTAHMVRTTGGRPGDAIETYHDRIRETVVARIGRTRLTEYHHRLALVLETSGEADPAEVGAHFAAAEEPERAAEFYATAAAEAAEALAFDRAANLYGLAVKFWPTAGAEQRDLRSKLADTLANAGRGPEAAREYLAAAEGASAAEALEMRRRAAMQSLISGHIDDGLAALRTVLAAVGMKFPKTPRRALLSLLLRRLHVRLRGLRFRQRDPTQVSAEELTRIDTCWSAAIGLSVVDPIRAADFQARGLLLSLRSGEPYRIARSLAMEGGHVAVAGGRTRGRVKRLLERAEDMARSTGNAHAIGLASMCKGIAAFLQGRWKPTLELCDEADKTFREHCTGVAWELNTAQTFSGWALFWMGDVNQLRRRLPLYIAEAQKRGNLYALANLGTFARPLISLAADDADSAHRDLQELMSRWSRESFHVQHSTGLLGQTQVEIYRGNCTIAWRRLMEQWPALASSLLLRVQQMRIYSFHLRASCALAAATSSENPDPLLRVAKKDARRLRREKMPWADALGQLVCAGLAAFHGDRSAAVTLLREVIDALEAVDMSLFAATARRRLGELIGGSEGHDLVAAADEWMAGQQIKNPERITDVFAWVSTNRPVSGD